LGAVDFVAHNVPSAYRKEGDGGIPAPPYTAEHEHGVTNTGSNQEVRSHGTWRGIDPGIVVWKANWRARNWYRFPCVNCAWNANCGSLAAKGASHSHAALAFLRVAEQFAKEKDRYLFQSER